MTYRKQRGLKTVIKLSGELLQNLAVGVHLRDAAVSNARAGQSRGFRTARMVRGVRRVRGLKGPPLWRCAAARRALHLPCFARLLRRQPLRNRTQAATTDDLHRLQLAIRASAGLI